LAVWLGAFWLLCLGTLVAGVYNAAGAYYRFAAADTAGTEFKSKAISLVMAGGIVGGVIGPETSKLTRELLPVTYLGTYLSLIAFALVAMAILRWIDIPRLSEHEREESGRPLAAIMAQPVFVVAVISAMVGYGVMNLLMTATPIAMTHHHHHHYDDAAFVLEWHVIGMFLPSFFTGSLIKRFGVLQVMLAGAVLMFLCIGFALSGTGLANFWIALVLLGVGWNFLFIGGTTLLTEAYTPPEKAKTQGINDLLVFLTMATSSFSSGALVTSTGWDALNWWSLPFLVATMLATLWLLVQRRLAPTPQVGA
ncbi:MAG TPA: MFS transporter, partial [Pelomicrobium sp.]|nr:MFS transporter [Pelomicrobium sp.]